MTLSDMVVSSFIQKFEESEQFCGFTLPFVFADGSPAIIHAHRIHADDIQLNDFGLNTESMIKVAANVNFNAEKKVKDLIKPFSSLDYLNGSIISKTTPDELLFSLLDYVDVLKQMVDYRYSQKESHVADVLASILQALKTQHHNIKLSPELTGRSGSRHKFNFGYDLNLIDFAAAKTEKTGQLLRKYIDLQSMNDDLAFTVIIDDTENDRYKSEQSILSDFAIVKPLSRYVSA